MFFVIEKPEENIFEFLQNSANILLNGNSKDRKFIKQFLKWISKICKKKMARPCE